MRATRPGRPGRAGPSGAPKPAAGTSSRSALSCGSTAPIASAPSRSDQNVRRSLSDSSTVSQAEAPGKPPRSNHDATVRVLPKPGPALTRVTGCVAPRLSAASNRWRRTSPGGTAGGDARSRNWLMNCSGTRASRYDYGQLGKASESARLRQPAQEAQTATFGGSLTRIEVLEPTGHSSGGSHTASASESVSAANTGSGEALMTRTAVSVRLIAGAPVAPVDHARAERPGLDQV